MKKFLWIPFALGVSLLPVQSQDTTTTTATNSQPVHPSGPATTIPSDSNYKAHPDFNKGCEQDVAAMKGKRCDIIFIGDSITRGWKGKPAWTKYYANRHVLNFGVPADTTQNVLWRMDHMDVKNFKPKVAVIMIGTNNAGDTPSDIAAGVKAVIAKTQEMYAGVKIILVSILPNQCANQKMMETNKIIKAYADNQTIYYLDLVPLFTPVGDNWKGMGADHLHPIEEGYQIWATAMQPLLDKLLSEDSAIHSGN